MSIRARYLYRLPGRMPSFLRALRFNRVRLTAILIIVIISISTIAFRRLQRPAEYVPTTSTVIPPPVLAPPIPPTPPLPEIAQPVAERVGGSLYHPFVLPHAAEYLANQMVRPIGAHSSISDACLDQWVSTGKWEAPCAANMVQDAVIDLVYVWVNGSDTLHQQARAALTGLRNYTVENKEARFREHDELRYSLRAARAATARWPISAWHIVTADVPHPNAYYTPDHQRRLGLVPQWLDIECTSATEPPIHLHHDTQIFRLTGRPGDALTAADATDWLGKVIPSFNSHAVESQLPHLDPEQVSENIVALNDDQFLLMALPPSAFHSTLYGPVFRMNSHASVDGDASGRADGGGEWRSLGWASYLLSQRFGLRKRPYMEHNARALSLPLMHEASLAFGSYFAATPLSQFRGSHNVSEELEVNTIFMATHFVIERHREALLWSWIVGKWGGAQGMLDREQKRRMWRELGGGEGDTLMLPRATRSSVENVELNMWLAGLQSPLSSDFKGVGNTRYSWVSMDGFSKSFKFLSFRTVITRGGCINEEPELAWDMFLRVAQSYPDCGDAVIGALMHASTSGLGIFLPPPSLLPTSASPVDPMILPLVLPASSPPLPGNPRAFAVRLLMRYAYVIGESPTEFIGLKTALKAKQTLQAINRRKDLTLLCINDDMKDSELEVTDAVLREWLQRRWPNKLQYEM
ncbi:hypothetical protein C8R44DRAFT_889358 [Mycena epipterygia]|nr:hypothetical protein C8R44DRAFT_889358 [Mycena epipterygia]